MDYALLLKQSTLVVSLCCNLTDVFFKDFINY